MSLALRDIAIVKAEVARLAATEARWSSPSYSSEDRVAFRAEWRDLMDVLADILDAYASGRVSEDDGRALRDLARDAVEAIPIMERLRLTLPPVATLEAITTASTRT